jgi:hypothetical protein
MYEMTLVCQPLVDLQNEIDNKRFMHYEEYSLLGCDTVQFEIT